MNQEEELQLSHQIDSDANPIDENQFQPNFMLQPITTQSKFNHDEKNKPKQPQVFNKDINQSDLIQPSKDQFINMRQVKYVKNLADEAKQFRLYLNQKVQQLRKSKDQISNNVSLESEKKPKSNALRKIINREELSQKQNQKWKSRPPLQKPLTLTKTKNSNPISQTSTQIYPINQESHSSIKEHQDENIKSSKLPDLASKNKITLPQSKSKPNHKEKNQNKKNLPQDEKEQVQKTSESKNSFRIKKTIAFQPNIFQHSNQDLNSRDIPMKNNSKEKFKQLPIHQGGNKKIRDEFIKLNEQERKIQTQILQSHQQTKKIIDSIMKKYNLSTEAFKKYGIRKQNQFSEEISSLTKSPSKKQIKQSRLQKSSEIQKGAEKEIRIESPLKKENRKNLFLVDELDKIVCLLKEKQKQVKKYDSRMQKNPFMQFMKQFTNEILQQSQNDEVDDLKQQNADTNHRVEFKFDSKEFSSTYSQVMTEMKNKKWNLKQRITFETHRNQLLDKKTAVNKKNQSKQKIIEDHDGEIDKQKKFLNNQHPYSKIQVNDCLKNLLID